jgi:hypothetical protein
MVSHKMTKKQLEKWRKKMNRNRVKTHEKRKVGMTKTQKKMLLVLKLSHASSSGSLKTALMGGDKDKTVMFISQMVEDMSYKELEDFKKKMESK